MLYASEETCEVAHLSTYQDGEPDEVLSPVRVIILVASFNEKKETDGQGGILIAPRIVTQPQREPLLLYSDEWLCLIKSKRFVQISHSGISEHCTLQYLSTSLGRGLRQSC